MKKSIVVITAVVVLSVSGLAFAQMGDKGNGMMNKDDKGDMMGGGMMGKGMGMMSKGMMMGMMKHGMMMKMMEKDVIATSDGGVIVVTANKISKYDKDLNLVKEVDLKVDTDYMQKMMGMMSGMMGKGMMGDMDKDKDDDEAGEATAKPADTVDHASHHQ